MFDIFFPGQPCRARMIRIAKYFFFFFFSVNLEIPSQMLDRYYCAVEIHDELSVRKLEILIRFIVNLNVLELEISLE